MKQIIWNVGESMQFIPNEEHYKRLHSEQFALIPVALKVEMPEVDRLALFEHLYKGSKRFIFESGGKSRYTIMGGNPEFECRDDLIHFQHYMRENTSPVIAGLPKCVGGAYGYFSYDFAWQLERLPNQSTKDLNYDDFYFIVCRDVLVIDEWEKQLYIVTHVEASAGYSYDEQVTKLTERHDDIFTKISVINEEGAKIIDDSLMHRFRHDDLTLERTAAFEKEQFIEAVLRIQEYIRSGDVFQVNLSVRQQASLKTEPIEIYRLLRELNPSPYMGFFDLPDYQLVSCSPELLIKIEDGIIETRPIAGTRPRTGNDEVDRQKAEELINNEKERAEHIMLVDLERNDLGRVCEYGTVEVSEYMVVENYSHVMHIVSHVRGKLASGEDAFSAIKACFPGGTITGAPKIRTMEIIEELEPVKRGPYTGSMGWIDFNGNMELNILIRTLYAEKGIGYIQAGAGIVIDSQPEQEYKESLRKAEAIWRAVQLSERQS